MQASAGQCHDPGRDDCGSKMHLATISPFRPWVWDGGLCSASNVIMSRRFLTSSSRDPIAIKLPKRHREASRPFRSRPAASALPPEASINDNAHPPQTLQCLGVFYYPARGPDRSTVASPPLRNRHRAVRALARLVLRSYNCV